MSLKIVSCSALTPTQCTEIERLQAAVYTAEKLQNTAWLSNEINFDRDVPCFFLGYEGEELVSFLTLFLPTRGEGEVTAFTAISHRGRGYFTALLDTARRVLRENGVPHLLLALEPASRSGMAYLKKHFPAAKHSHTEWRMTCVPNYVSLPENITVERVTAEKSEDYVSVVLKEYGGDRDAVLVRLSAEERMTYLVRDAGTPVGVFALAEGEALTLFGVVTAENLRGRGYGNCIVRAALNKAYEAGKNIELDVDSENPPALHLYRKYGFEPTFEVQYWRAKTD